MGRFKGSGAFGDEAWISSGSVAFSPSSEFMSLAGYIKTDAATPVWEWNANWLASEGNETDSGKAINVLKQQNRPLIIIDIFGTWRHNTYWLHSVVIVIIFFDAATGKKNACRFGIKESGQPTAKDHFRVKGVVTVELPAAQDMSKR